MNPLIKWPGGKTGEIRKIEHLVPEYDRYIEPFFGGGALFFHLKPKSAVINDISCSLIEFYRFIKAQDTALYDLLMCYCRSFADIQSSCAEAFDDILNLYKSSYKSITDKTGLGSRAARITAGVLEKIGAGFFSMLVLDKEEFFETVVRSVSDKILRTVSNNRKKQFPDEDLKNSLITGFTGGYYTYFRKVFNDISLGRISPPSAQYKAANFYFIREYCYGAMFRYNAEGEFNIPYGGMSYNTKNIRAKIDCMFSGEAADVFRNTEIECGDFEKLFGKIKLTERDFMFVDPPYDTDFSDYEGKDFTRADQERLAIELHKTKAMFILVIKNTDFIKGLYEDSFNILSFDNRYTYNVRSRNERNTEHLLITNLNV